VGILAYWLSNFLWDLLSWIPPLLITLALLYAFGIKTYTQGRAAGAFVALFLAFAPAATAFTYVWTFCFSSHSAAQTVTLFLSFLTGLVLSITSIVLSLIDSTRAISLKLRYVFRLFPAYCFGDGLLQLAFCVDDVCPKVRPYIRTYVCGWVGGWMMNTWVGDGGMSIFERQQPRHYCN
jgi:ATP-binding cassette, subfamily A (ABC1), member 3